MYATSFLVLVDVHSVKFRILFQRATWWQNENIDGECFHAGCIIRYLVFHVNIDGSIRQLHCSYLVSQLNIEGSTYFF